MKITTTTNIEVAPVAAGARKRRRLIGILMDRSASMTQAAPEVESGIAEFLEEQAKAEEELKARGEKVRTDVLLAQFGSTYEVVYGPVRLQDAPEYRMEVRGMTALYDSISSIVQALKANIAERAMEGKKPQDVVLVIMTDGQENHSRELRYPHQVKAIIDACKADGWQVLFLAANQDAVLTGQTLGVAPEMSLTYSATNSSGTVLRSAGKAVASSYVSASAVSFSNDDREAVQ